MKNTVTICGSRFLGYKSAYLETVKAKLTSIIGINPNITFNIGDATGADKIAQEMLYEMQSSTKFNVKIWHIKNKLRNCIDLNWEKVSIRSTRYTDRDKEMIKDTTLGLICLWNGSSKGTENNIIQSLGRIDVYCYIPKNLRYKDYVLNNCNKLKKHGGSFNVHYV